MLRVWILSFVAVALVVGAVLFFTREVEPEQQPAPTSEQTYPQSLTTNDVLTYIEVWPKVDAIFRAAMSSGDPTRVNMDDEVRGVLAIHSLSKESWASLWKRVENAINGIRTEKENPARLAKIQNRIEIKKAAVAGADGKLKDQLEKDLAELEAARDRKIRAIHPADREVIMRFWDQLNRIAPRIGR